jgi:predicted amidohydrolase YtcJ
MTIRPLTPLDTIILNGTVVTAADIARYDIGIKDGKIAVLAPAGSLADPPSPTTRIIDAQGAYVMPGGVDAHVHLAEPQLFGKGKAADDYCTGILSLARVAGERVIVMANWHRHKIRHRRRHNNNNRLRATRQILALAHQSPRRDRLKGRGGRILRLLFPPPHREPDTRSTR